jgi:hypothetical protein
MGALHGKDLARLALSALDAIPGDRYSSACIALRDLNANGTP